eukprot:1507433-Amphidinium_carterae.1
MQSMRLIVGAWSAHCGAHSNSSNLCLESLYAQTLSVKPILNSHHHPHHSLVWCQPGRFQ